VRQVQVFYSFDVLPAEWEVYFNQASNTSIFYSLPWFKNYVRTVLGIDNESRIYAINKAGTTIALLPMQVKSGSGLLIPRTLQGLVNYYSSLFGPILSDTDSQGALEELAIAISKERPKWDIIDLHPLDREAATFNQLLQVFKRAGLWATPYYCFGNWYLEVNGRSYKDYFQSLPSRLKNTLKRKNKQLDVSANVHIEILTGGENLDKAINDYVTIYNVSWKQVEPYPNFIPGLIHTCAEQGWLRLGVVYVNGQPAAAQLWIIHGGTAAIYKLAHNKQYDKLSIGSILTAALMEHVIDVDKVTVIDYLTGDDAYKKDWMSHRRERWGIVAYNPYTPRGLLAAIRHFGGGKLKSLVHAISRSRR
jgi:CelD/BcsL family acetyltransferase involved in cellulose biosynthesis